MIDLCIFALIVIDSLENNAPKLSSAVRGLCTLLFDSIYSTRLFVKLYEGLSSRVFYLKSFGSLPNGYSILLCKFDK